MLIREIVKRAGMWFPGRRKKTILVSDYDSIIRQSLSELLQEQGYTVLVAAHSGTAVQIADKERPDLILLDNNTLLLSGTTAVAILRSNAHTRDIPIIIISPNNRISDVEECLSQGANDYVVKPFDTDHLLTKIRNLLSEANKAGEISPLPAAAAYMG
jgi:DNA-binding response OmpR family regulator